MFLLFLSSPSNHIYVTLVCHFWIITHFCYLVYICLLVCMISIDLSLGFLIFFLSCFKTTDEPMWAILHLILFYFRVCVCVILSFIDHLSAPAIHLVLSVFYLSTAVFNMLIIFTLNSDNSNLCYI